METIGIVLSIIVCVVFFVALLPLACVPFIAAFMEGRKDRSSNK